MESWNEMLVEEMGENGDESKIIHCTLSSHDMNVKFDTGYGGECGKAFTAWSEERVYFPICYDGAEWVGSAPRNPCDESLNHQGGG